MQVSRRIPYYGCLLLLAYMPFHVFISQSFSLLSGGLNEWKIAKDVFLAVLTLITVGLVWYLHETTRLFRVLVALTSVYSGLLLFIWALHPHIYRTSAILGTTYDLRLFCYAIVGYGATLLTSVHRKSVLQLVLIVGTVVAALGVVQYFLSPNLLTHFGYSIARGTRPNFFIDNNPAFPRVMSTIRDPNSLGAYLLLPVGLLSAFLLRARTLEHRLLIGLVLSVQLVAVYLTFSRSAWAGAAIVVALVVWWQYRHWFIRLARRYWPVIIVLVVLAGGVAYMGRHSPIFTHQTNLQVGKYDSNQLHLYFAEQNLKGIIHNPFGHGPGTAGLASIHNPAGANLTENYYLQIGYEAGIAGLILFVAFQVLLYMKLWPERRTYIGLTLLATFWAYVLINMVLQEWDNEAVAAQWWILAGMALCVSRPPVAAEE